MKVTFEGTLEGIKQEMREFLSEKTTVVTSKGPVDLPKESAMKELQPEPPTPVVEYPKRTKAETQALMKEIIGSPDGRKAVKALLARFGVAKFTELSEEHYGEFYAGLEGVQ